MSQGRTGLTRGFERVFSLSSALQLNERRAHPEEFPDLGISVDPNDGDLKASIERSVSRQRFATSDEHHRIVEFVALLFDEESDECTRMVDAFAEENGDPQFVADALFAPAARLIGENWCGDECDFMKVTIALSRMQRLFRQLVSDFPPPVRADISRCVLLAPASGEQHLFGLSIVDDAFRRAGWEVDCCGFGEEAEVFRLVTVNHYQIIGLSVSVDRHLPDIVATVQKLRSRSHNRSVIIMAGGSMVMRAPEKAADAGFDMLTVDAQSAVRLAETVIARQALNRDLRIAAE
jgi:methanogenic corrinoid protein MtbC1